MTEYYFRSTCIVRREPLENKGREIDLKLFQDYRNNGEYCVQVVVTPWPKKYGGVRWLHIAYGLDVPQPIAFTHDLVNTPGKSEYIRKADIEKDGSFFITNTQQNMGGNKILSGVGLFAFVEKEDSVPKLEDTYVYAINFGEKQKIIYNIEKYERKIRVEINYPLLRSKLDLSVSVSNKGKPLEAAKNSKFINASIQLEAGKLNKFSTIIPTDTAGNDYRLHFVDPSDSEYYLLVDESKESTEERVTARGKELFNNKRYFNEHTNTSKCPYCFNPLKVPDETDKTKRKAYGCDGTPLNVPPDTPIEQYMIKTNRTRLIYCNREYRKPELIEELKDYGRFIIPADYHMKLSMNVAIIGDSYSGKSVIMSTIIGASVISRAEGRGYTIQAMSYILNSIINKLDKRKSTVEMLSLDRVDFSSDKTVQIVRDSISQKNNEMVENQYLVAVNKPLPESTPDSDLPLLSVHPFGFKLGDMGYAYFYDLPGESVMDSKAYNLRTVEHADCLIVIIDGYDKNSLKNAVVYTQNALEKALKVRGESLYDIPIAIILSKFDNFINDLDKNCHIVMEDMLKMLDEETFEGSDIARHINCSSYELEHYLKSQDCARFLNTFNNYKYLRFFAVSALGNEKCFQRIDNKKFLLYRERSLRLELPLVWLMYQRGIIKK